MDTIEKNVILKIIKNLRDLSNDVTNIKIGMTDIVICKSLNDNINVLEALVLEETSNKNNIQNNNIMAENTKFRVLYHTKAFDVVEDICEILEKQFKLTMKITSDDEDDYIEYEIIKM